MKFFTIFTTHFTEESKTRRISIAFTILASNIESAYRKVKSRYIPGSSTMMWVEETDPTNRLDIMCCNSCAGPWHPATGHWNPEKQMIWCLRCYMIAIRLYKSMHPRRYNKVRFYDHSCVPPEKPPIGWEAE